MAIKKLVVREYEVDGDIKDGKITVTYTPGWKYSYFVDPETGKYYKPKETFFVTGEDLEDLFEEVQEY